MAGDNPKLCSSTKPHILLLVSLAILLRTRIVTGPRDLVHRLTQVGFSTELSPSELDQALQQLYIEESDGTRQLLVPFRNNISKVRLLIFRLSFSLTARAVSRSRCIPLQILSSRRINDTSRPSPPLRKTSQMLIAPFSANSWLSCA
jgi:hypothetical protein